MTPPQPAAANVRSMPALQPAWQLLLWGFVCFGISFPAFAMSQRLIALTPVTIAENSAPTVISIPSRAEASETAAVLAEGVVEGTRFAVRSGRRTVGVRPRFPSAALVIAVREGEAWREVAFVDEDLGREIEDVGISAASGKLRVRYRVRRDGQVVSRAAELPLPVPPSAASGWREMPSYPLAPGMAGIIAGTDRGVLIAAGGANFPGRPPWDGGTKVYYDEIFVLVPGESTWRAAGRLPRRRAYAAVVSTPHGVLVAGGENADEVFADAFWLRWDGAAVQIEPAPSLSAPATCAMAAVLDGKVYLAGGYAPGAVRLSRRDFHKLDLFNVDAGWTALPGWPGPARALGVIAALEDAIYLVSGLEVVAGGDGKLQSTYLRDAYRFRRDTWERLPDPPWSAIAAPSPAPVTTRPARLFVLGGVDGTQVGKLPRDTRVPEDIAYFDVAAHAWRLWSEPWMAPVVTSPAVRLDQRWVIVSGETMAGVRTTAVWSWEIGGAP